MEAQHMLWAHSMPVCSGVKVLNVSVKSCWIISMPPPQRTWRWRISHMLPCQIFGSCFAAWFAPCLRLQRSLLRLWRTMATKQWPWDGLFWKAFSYRLSWDWVDLHPLSQVYFDLFCPSHRFYAPRICFWCLTWSDHGMSHISEMPQHLKIGPLLKNRPEREQHFNDTNTQGCEVRGKYCTVWPHEFPVSKYLHFASQPPKACMHFLRIR